jgi:hypothetical protein
MEALEGRYNWVVPSPRCVSRRAKRRGVEEAKRRGEGMSGGGNARVPLNVITNVSEAISYVLATQKLGDSRFAER